MSTPSQMKSKGAGAAAETMGLDNESLRNFVSMAVHDLREPLRAIRLGVKLMESGPDESQGERQSAGARYAEAGVDRMELLIRDLSECCYEEMRNHDARETDLELVLREARNDIAGEISSCGATVSHDPLPSVWGDFSSLAAALRCLIGNACKFRGDASPLIHVSAKLEGSEWIVSVRDNGQGFDPAYRERIFRPFERLNGRQYPGSGLGLTLARRIVEHHGGQMWADSRPGQGSAFHFSLPLNDS